MIPPLRFVLGVAALVALSACGVSALQLNAEAASTLGAALNIAGTQLVAHREADQVAAEVHAATVDEAHAAVAAVRARYAPLVAAEEAAALSQRLYADAVIEFAASRTTMQHVLSLALALVPAYQSLRLALAPVGIVLPEVPAAVLALLPANGATP